MNKPLDIEIGKQIIDAVNRLTQLEGLAVLDKNAEAEKAGLHEYIRNQLFDHAGHLLGCWYAVRNEYEPLCQTFASILNRAAGINAQRKAADAALSKADNVPGEVKSSNVVEGEALAKQEGESDLVAPPGAPMILKPQFTGGKKRR